MIQHASHEQVAPGNTGASPGRPAVAVSGGALADQLGEPRRERAKAGEADQHAHLGHRQVGGAQEILCPLDAAAGQIADRRFTVGRLEAAGKVELGDSGDGRKPIKIERMLIVPVDVIARTAQVRQQLGSHHPRRRPGHLSRIRIRSGRSPNVGGAAYARGMARVHQLSRQDARRVAVRAQLLQRDRPADLVSMVRQLTLLQLDPVSAVAPSADLIAWSRLGSAYSPAKLRAALDDRRLIELRAFVRPAEDLALYRAEMAEWPGRPGRGELRDWQEYHRDWVLANDRCRREILARLRDAGPLPSRELPDTCDKPWGSTGWTNDKNVTRLLEFMVSRGEVAVAGRKGRDRLWDLAERVYPDDPVIPAGEA